MKTILLTILLLSLVTKAHALSIYDIGVYFPGVPNSSQVLLRFVVVRPTICFSSLPNSQALLGVATTGTTTYPIKKNTSSIGSVVFTGASGTVATFTFASTTTFVAGDVLEIDAPASPDATAANLSVTIECTK